MSGLYQIIGDEAQVREFYRRHILPFSAEKYRSFLLLLHARRKYHAEMSNSQRIINTKPVSSKISENQFVRELRKYEVAEGLYVDSVKDLPIPNEALVIYMTADPLDEIQSFFGMQNELNSVLQELVQSSISSQVEDSIKIKIDTQEKTTSLKVINRYKSWLHKSNVKKFHKLDVDTKDTDKITNLRNLFLKEGIILHLVIESRGGYHVIIDKEHGILSNDSHRQLHLFCQQNKEWITIEKNALLVIPGTIQGGFLTRIVDWSNNPSSSS